MKAGGQAGREREHLGRRSVIAEMPAPNAAPAPVASTSTNVSGLDPATSELLARIFNDIKSRDESIRIAAGHDLAQHAITCPNDFKGDHTTPFNNDLNRYIFSLTHSPHINEKLGGIYAIEILADTDHDESGARLFRFYQYLKINLPCNDAIVMIAASRALGGVCKHGAQSLGDPFMEFEVLRALDYLQGEMRF